jgi:hypothetical protein
VRLMVSGNRSQVPVWGEMMRAPGLVPVTANRKMRLCAFLRIVFILTNDFLLPKGIFFIVADFPPIKGDNKYYEKRIRI